MFVVCRFPFRSTHRVAVSVRRSGFRPVLRRADDYWKRRERFCRAIRDAVGFRGRTLPQVALIRWLAALPTLVDFAVRLSFPVSRTGNNSEIF
jgi:hypothetical protein